MSRRRETGIVTEAFVAAYPDLQPRGRSLSYTRAVDVEGVRVRFDPFCAGNQSFVVEGPYGRVRVTEEYPRGIAVSVDVSREFSPLEDDNDVRAILEGTDPSINERFRSRFHALRAQERIPVEGISWTALTQRITATDIRYIAESLRGRETPQ